MALNILDGVNLSEHPISKEAKNLSQLVKNSSLNLIDRLESFQDVINLEVGDTGLSRARSLEREFDIRQIYLKFEGTNPTGTQKDRIAFAQVHDALRRGFETISVATCGNYGAAISFAAALAGIHCAIFIPQTFHTERILEMEHYGAEIIRHHGTYEQTVFHSIEEARKNDWYDANPGGENTPLQILTYAEIAYEIYDTLRDAPKIVAVPVSNGTLLAGIYRGFVALYKRGKTSRIPIIIAASSAHKNPIVSSFIKGLDHCEDLDPEKIKETKINEPLINWHSFDGEEALYALQQSNGAAFNVNDKNLIKMSKILEKMEGLRVLPASTAGLLGLLEYMKSKPLDPDRFVVILTAKN